MKTRIVLATLLVLEALAGVGIYWRSGPMQIPLPDYGICYKQVMHQELQQADEEELRYEIGSTTTSIELASVNACLREHVIDEDILGWLKP